MILHTDVPAAGAAPRRDACPARSPARGAGAVERLVYATELRTIRETYALRASQRRASADIADVARAATFGLVDTVLVDIDEVLPGASTSRRAPSASTRQVTR